MTEKMGLEIRLRQRYSEDFKRSICDEYLLTGASTGYLHEKYGIPGSSSICKWIKLFGVGKTGYLDKPIPVALPKENTPDKPQKDLTPEQRIKQLERELADEKLRSYAYKRMLEIAEQELKVPIKKKPFIK